jgi:hypothetical protein
MMTLGSLRTPLGGGVGVKSSWSVPLLAGKLLTTVSLTPTVWVASLPRAREWRMARMPSLMMVRPR